MRQYISVAFLFLGIQYVFIGNWKKYFLCQVTAVLFHSSEIIGIILMLIFKFVQDNKKEIDNNPKLKNNILPDLKTWVVIGIGASTLLVTPLIVKLLNLLNLSKYSVYISGNIHFMPNQIISRLPMLILFIIFYLIL